MVLTTNRAAVIFLGVLAQIIMTIFFFSQLQPTVEERLTREARRALQEANVSWARVSAKGPDLTISGMAPNAQLKERALAIAEGVDGVRKLTDELLVTSTKPTPQSTEETERRAAELLADIEDTAPIFAVDLPYELHLSVEASVLTLSGLVPDDVSRDSLLNLANRRFGEGRLIDRLITSPGAPDGYLSAATQGVEVAGELVEGIVVITGDQVVVQGVTAQSDSEERIIATLDDNLPANYTTSVQAGDQQELNDLLRSHPDLAARVGVLKANSEDNTVIETVRRPITAETIQKPIESGDCATQFSAQLSAQPIMFSTGSVDIADDSLELMDRLVNIAKQCPQTVVEIGGHTDDLGSETNNLALSQRRAESVMAYMVRNGIALGRLYAVGYGENQPLVENNSADNRQLNRRIEFRVIEEQSP